MTGYPQESPSERIFKIHRVQVEIRGRDGGHFKACVTFFDNPRYLASIQSFSLKLCTHNPCRKTLSQNKNLFHPTSPGPETNFRAFVARVIESRADLCTIRESSPRRTFWYTTLTYFTQKTPTNATSYVKKSSFKLKMYNFCFKFARFGTFCFFRPILTMPSCSARRGPLGNMFFQGKAWKKTHKTFTL